MSAYESLFDLGYVEQVTPAGRTIMVNPAFYPMSEADLIDHDNFLDWADKEDPGMNRYDDWSDIDMGDY